ncbi:MAG: hypothetical protein RH946_08675 [Rhodospirillales bacterium]
MADKKPDIINNPNAPEIYADRTASVSLRGNVARISLASERSGADPKNPESVISGHLVMPVRGFIQLYAQMQSVVKQMEASGMLQAKQGAAAKPAPAAGKTASKAASKAASKSPAKKKTAASSSRSKRKKS